MYRIGVKRETGSWGVSVLEDDGTEAIRIAKDWLDRGYANIYVEDSSGFVLPLEAFLTASEAGLDTAVISSASDADAASALASSDPASSS